MADEQPPVAAKTETPPPEPTPAEALAAAYEEFADPDLAEAPSVEGHTDEQPAPVVPAPALSPKPSVHLVAIAENLGLDKADAESMTDESLSATLRVLSKQAKAKPTVSPLTVPEADEVVDLGIDESAYDPDLLKGIKKAIGDTRKETKAAKAELAQMKQAEQGRQQEAFATMVETSFSGLGDGYHGVFGKGRVKDSDPGFKRRLAVMQSIQADPPKVATYAEALAIRAKEMFGDLAAASPPDTLSERKVQYRNGGLAKPTQRTPNESEPVGRRAAIRAVSDIKKDMGIADDADDSDSTSPY